MDSLTVLTYYRKGDVNHGINEYAFKWWINFLYNDIDGVISIGGASPIDMHNFCIKINNKLKKYNAIFHHESHKAIAEYHGEIEFASQEDKILFAMEWM